MHTVHAEMIVGMHWHSPEVLFTTYTHAQAHDGAAMAPYTCPCTYLVAIPGRHHRLKTSAGLNVNSTAAKELGLHGYMLFDEGLNNDTLAYIGD